MSKGRRVITGFLILLLRSLAVADCQYHGVWHKDLYCSNDNSSDNVTHYKVPPAPVHERPQIIELPYEPPPLSPKDRASLINKEGVALFNSGSFAEARAKFQRALELDSSDNTIRSNFAQSEAELAFRASDYVRAIQQIRAAIDFGRSDLYGRLKYFQREQKRMEDDWRRAKEKKLEETRQREIKSHDALLTVAYHQAIESAEARWAANRLSLSHAIVSSEALLSSAINRGSIFTDSSLHNGGSAEVDLLSIFTSKLKVLFERSSSVLFSAKELFKTAKPSAEGFLQGVLVAGSPHRELLEDGVEPVWSGLSFGDSYRKYVLGVFSSDVFQAVNAAPSSLTHGNEAATMAAEEALSHDERGAREFQGDAVQSAAKDAAEHLGKSRFDGLLPDWLLYHGQANKSSTELLLAKP
jgi:hypothetical protein